MSLGDDSTPTTPALGPVGERIARLLRDALSPSELRVMDESNLHSGHAGARAEGESHFRIRVVARAFTGKSRLERHRMIHRVLADALREGVHAIAIEAVADES